MKELKCAGRFAIGFLIVCLCAVVVSIPASAESKKHATPKVKPSKPEPPPVSIELTTDQSSAYTGQTIKINLKVAAQERMHARIECFLPEGLILVKDSGIQTRPLRQPSFEIRDSSAKGKNARFRETIEFWRGSLEAGETKEFSFRVTIPKKGSYKLFARVDAMSKWDKKDKDLRINVR